MFSLRYIRGFRMEVSAFTIRVWGAEVGVLVVEMSAPWIQFLLTNQLGQVISLSYVHRDGSVEWKFGCPADPYVIETEAQLRRLFGL